MQERRAAHVRLPLIRKRIMKKRNGLWAVGALITGIVCIVLIFIFCGTAKNNRKQTQQTGAEMTEASESRKHKDESGQNRLETDRPEEGHAGLPGERPGVQQESAESGGSGPMVSVPAGNDLSEGEVILKPSDNGNKDWKNAGEDAEKETDANAGKNDGQKDENGNREPSEGDNQDSEVELPIVPAKPH